MAEGARRRGRPSLQESADGPGSRERILASARAEFARHGYDRASIRGIARGAGVDPALVHHYLGTKEQVFVAAVEQAFRPALAVAEALPAGDREGLGERVVRVVFGVWEDPETREPLLAIVRSAMINETAAELFRGMVTRLLLERLAGELPGEDAPLRVELAVAQLVGTAILRYVIKVRPLAQADVEQLVRRLAPVVEHHLYGPEPGASWLTGG
ncbi:TetR family transcriptional regulator [Streptomyces sp. NPDC005438]|uniref:TetR/AcrR family transcriptional regulator n=1 Tax=Streptomyces sp. NPDC005438 TaxID=3156880 RepID=UPI0033AC63B6